jgi:hypothetical protein
VYFGLIRSFFGRQQEIEPPRRQVRKVLKKSETLAAWRLKILDLDC